MNHLQYLGAAYAFIWLLIFAYVWRLNKSCDSLNKQIDELKRSLETGAGD
ncbi:MAG: CcmD family protein [Candidatus Binatia bacterium]